MDIRDPKFQFGDDRPEDDHLRSRPGGGAGKSSAEAAAAKAHKKMEEFLAKK